MYVLQSKATVGSLNSEESKPCDISERTQSSPSRFLTIISGGKYALEYFAAALAPLPI
jgi:hypothetical protein